MRTREEIEDRFTWVAHKLDRGTYTETHKFRPSTEERVLETLLDIRELLSEEKIEITGTEFIHPGTLSGQGRKLKD